MANQTQQTAPQIEGVTSVTVIDPTHPLYGRTFPYTPRGEKSISIQLPDGQRRLVPRSATNLEGENRRLTTSLPKISIRTILPVAQLVKAKLVTEENQYENASGSGGNNRKDIEKATRASTPGPEAVETIHSPTAKTPGKTLGAAPATSSTLPGTEQGGAGC